MWSHPHLGGGLMERVAVNTDPVQLFCLHFPKETRLLARRSEQLFVTGVIWTLGVSHVPCLCTFPWNSLVYPFCGREGQVW